MPPVDNAQLELDLKDADRGDNLDDATTTTDDGVAKPDAPAADTPPGTSTDKLDGAADDDLETEEERAEREAAEKAAAEKAERDKRIRIPKARFDEAQAKARAREATLMQRIQELEAAVGTDQRQVELSKVQQEINALQDKYEDLILEGDKDGARKVRAELDRRRDEFYDYKARTASEHARKAAIEDLKYDSALANLESKYPELNPDAAELFDQDKTDEVALLMDAFQRQGANRVAALTKAVRYVMGDDRSVPRGTTEQVDTKKLAERQVLDAKRRAAEAAKSQPPITNKVGTADRTSGAVDVSRLTQKSFAALDEDTLSKLRGDEL